jgi:hypothetical protein
LHIYVFEVKSRDVAMSRAQVRTTAKIRRLGGRLALSGIFQN